jgi:hypothetical protein
MTTFMFIHLAASMFPCWLALLMHFVRVWDQMLLHMVQVAKFCERSFLRGLDVVGSDAVKDHFGSSQLPGLPTNNPLFSA